MVCCQVFFTVPLTLELSPASLPQAYDFKRGREVNQKVSMQVRALDAGVLNRNAPTGSRAFRILRVMSPAGAWTEVRQTDVFLKTDRIESIEDLPAQGAPA